VTELGEKLQAARSVRRLKRSTAAQRLWNDWYFSISDEEAGIVGEITNRAEAQVIRFSMTYGCSRDTCNRGRRPRSAVHGQ
jgi:hypothetical protein